MASTELGTRVTAVKFPTLLESLVKHRKQQRHSLKHNPHTQEHSVIYITGYLKPKINLYSITNIFV